MTPKELLHEGRLREAIEEQERLLRDRPTDADGRLFACELQLFGGKLELARGHLDAISSDTPGMPEFLRGYRRLLDAESKRRRLLVDADPEFLVEPSEHLLARLDALKLLRLRRFAEAVDALDEADALFPCVSGHVDGRAFEGGRDVDDLFGPVLEVIAEDRYCWYPFEQIVRLRLNEPESLRDYYFVPAHMTARGRQEWSVHLPALYPGSHLLVDDDLRLGRASDWVSEKNGPLQGQGARMLTFGEEELTLFEFTLWER